MKMSESRAFILTQTVAILSRATKTTHSIRWRAIPINLNHPLQMVAVETSLRMVSTERMTSAKVKVRIKVNSSKRRRAIHLRFAPTTMTHNWLAVQILYLGKARLQKLQSCSQRLGHLNSHLPPRKQRLFIPKEQNSSERKTQSELLLKVSNHHSEARNASFNLKNTCLKRISMFKEKCSLN